MLLAYNGPCGLGRSMTQTPADRYAKLYKNRPMK